MKCVVLCVSLLLLAVHLNAQDDGSCLSSCTNRYGGSACCQEDQTCHDEGNAGLCCSSNQSSCTPREYAGCCATCYNPEEVKCCPGHQSAALCPHNHTCCTMETYTPVICCSPEQVCVNEWAQAWSCYSLSACGYCVNSTHHSACEDGEVSGTSVGILPCGEGEACSWRFHGYPGGGCYNLQYCGDTTNPYFRGCLNNKTAVNCPVGPFQECADNQECVEGDNYSFYCQDKTSNCGDGLEQCNGQCYDKKYYDCLGSMHLCPKGFLRCGDHCYDPKVYKCEGEMLCMKGDGFCGNTCYDDESYVCCTHNQDPDTYRLCHRNDVACQSDPNLPCA